MNEKKEAYHLCIRVSCIFLKAANKFYPFIDDLVMVSRFRLNKYYRLYLCNVIKILIFLIYILRTF